MSWSKTHFTALFLPGILIASLAFFADLIGLGNGGSGFGAKQFMLLGAGACFSLFGTWLSFQKPASRKAWILAIWSTGFSYTLFEASISFFAWKNYPYFDSIWLYEESDQTIHFDKDRGMWLTSKPARVSRLTNGKPEYVGLLKGNNAGFPDRDDFGPKRKIGERRIAIFGDSFSAGQFLDTNWPDRAEDLLKQKGRPLTLLNFSYDGIGLGNWASFVTNILEAKRYEIDGAIFAVFSSDLWRTFTVANHAGFKRHMTGRTASWDPKDNPKNDGEACKFLFELPGFIISKDEFTGYLAGTWPLSIPRPKTPIVSTWLRNRLSSWGGSHSEKWEDLGKPLTMGQKILIEKMHQYFLKQKIRPIVVYLAAKDELFYPSAPSDYSTVREFSNLMEAEFIDGRAPFNRLSKNELKTQFFPVDGHWNQAGSDTFANFMAQTLSAKAFK